MAWLQSTYTIRLNHRHKLVGHVLSGRYKCQLVEGSGNGYLKTACDYVHLNPVRARMLKPEERLLAYPWSSFGAYVAAPASVIPHFLNSLPDHKRHAGDLLDRARYTSTGFVNVRRILLRRL